jgi:glycosyltransferase involved in cell wall biosynthesis
MIRTIESDAGQPGPARNPPAGHAVCVTIVIAVYNRCRFLDQAIRSALGQSYENVQVIVVDDGSEVDLGPVVSKYDGRVDFIRKPNGGVASARNVGITRARGSYVIFLDDDDYLEPAAVETLLAALHGQPGTAWVAGGCAYVDELGRTLDGKKGLTYESGDRYERMIYDCLMSCPSSVLVQTDVVRAVGGFDEDVCPSEDYDLWLSLARDYPLRVTTAIVTNYRSHAQQISSAQWERHYQTQLRVLAKHRARARPGFDSAFERSIADTEWRYGDSLYVSGHPEAAREHWRKSLTDQSGRRRRHLLGRFAKSYLPRPLLESLRTVAGWTRARRVAARGLRRSAAQSTAIS